MTEENKNFAYCLKQKSVKEMKDAIINKTTNNRRYMSGICIDCGCKMNKFLKKEQLDKKEDEKKEVKQDENDEKVKEDDKVKDEGVKEMVNHLERKIKKIKRTNIKKPLIE